MAEASAAALVVNDAENLLFLAVRRDHQPRSKSMIRRALAGVLAVLLLQTTFGAGFEQIAGAAPHGGAAPLAGIAPTSATAEALARSAPISVLPASSSNATPAEGPLVLAPIAGAPQVIPVGADASGACPRDMVLVEGEYCTEVMQDCLRWLDDETLPFARCAEYRSPARCVGSRVKERFCIDRYEYTAPGEDLPLNYASFEKATTVCGGLGKRVCTESEWNFACEGEEMRPYPYGFSREATCNQDRTDLYEPNPHYQILADRREPAAARPGCVSPFGVYNMAGNMDEPVLREGSAHVEPYRNALKGGWWMAARNRCRPATTAHDDYYKDIQVGVRCCSAAT
jgi:sulfatase modifying factor 1